MASTDPFEVVAAELGYTHWEAMNDPEIYDRVNLQCERSKSTGDYFREFNDVRKNRGLLSALSNDFDSILIREGIGNKVVKGLVNVLPLALGYTLISGLEALGAKSFGECFSQPLTPMKISLCTAYLMGTLLNRKK